MGPFRKIIHLDLDAFYCAVESQRDPKLRGLPFAVGGRPDQRGVVASCSYAARGYGVRSAMPMSRALRLCPDLVVVPGNFPAYREASRAVMARLREVTPLVEQLSIDEAFLEVTDLPEPAADTARRLQERIHRELELPCSLGVATNKLVAKIANDYGKSQKGGDSPPRALTIVPPGEEARFLAPLPVRALWGVGPKTEARLHAMEVRTIGDLAQIPEEILAKTFGKNGTGMGRRARGEDDSPVVTEREAKSISQEITFSRDVSDRGRLEAEIRKKSARLAGSLKKRDLSAATIRIKVRWPDFTTLTRQVTLAQATDEDSVIADTAWELFTRIWKPGKPVRLLGVGVSGLGERPKQLELGL